MRERVERRKLPLTDFELRNGENETEFCFFPVVQTGSGVTPFVSK